MVVEPRGAVVPAVRLAWRLQVLTGAAAVPVVPLPLIDRVAEPLVGVGQLRHPRPHEDGRATSSAHEELVEVDLAVRVSSRVARVVLQFAVAAHNFAHGWVLKAVAVPFSYVVVVLGDLGPCGLGHRSSALRGTITVFLGPLIGER